MNKFNSTLIATALTLALSGAAFAQDVQEPLPADPVTTDTMAPATDAEVTFDQLDTDADGFVAKSDIPVEHELSLQFAVADSDSDSRLSQAEFDAYVNAPEEEEAEE